MTKAKILKLFPERKEILKQLKSKEAQLTKLSAEVEKLRGLQDDLANVEVVELEKGSFPIKWVVDDGDDSVAVYPAFEGNDRYVIIMDEIITGYPLYRGEVVDLGPLGKLKDAKKVAAHYIATGKPYEPEKPAKQPKPAKSPKVVEPSDDASEDELNGE